MSKSNNTTQPVSNNDRSRTAELVLGIIGGIFGMIAGIIAITIGGIGNLGIACIVVPALAIVLSALINRNHVLMGWLLILCGVLNVVFVSFFGILSGLLIVIAGGLALRK